MRGVLWFAVSRLCAAHWSAVMRRVNLTQSNYLPTVFDNSHLCLFLAVYTLATSVSRSLWDTVKSVGGVRARARVRVAVHACNNLPKETRNRLHILYACMRPCSSCHMQRTWNFINTRSPSCTHMQSPPPHPHTRPHPVQSVGKQCRDDNYLWYQTSPPSSEMLEMKFSDAQSEKRLNAAQSHRLETVVCHRRHAKRRGNGKVDKDSALDSAFSLML